MNRVDALLEKNFSQYSVQVQKEIHRLGPHQPTDIIISQSTPGVIRKFNTKKFEDIKWLTVSENKKALFCFYCLLFQPECAVDTWTKKGFNDIGHLSQSIKSHENSKSHIINAIAFKRFGREPSIAVQLDEGYDVYMRRRNDLVRKNRRVLSKIIDCIKFCAMHEIALRGHDETTDSLNRGIFLDLLYKEAASDPELHEHLESGAHFASKDAQNELLDCIFILYLEVIVKEVNSAQFLSIQVDETTGISNSSQFVIVLRYVKDTEVVERFFKYVNVIDRSAAGLALTLRDELEQFNVRDKLIAQTFDGAVVMSGTITDVQQRVKDSFPHAKFVHCCAHQLNLILKQAVSGIKACRFFFANLSAFAVFFSQSSKRTDKLKQVCARQLPRPSEIRWNFQSQLLESVFEQRESLLKCFQEIQTEDKWDDTSVWNAVALEKFLMNDEFLFFLEFFNKLFKLANVLANILQSRSATPLTASRAIEAFRYSAEKLRNETNFNEPSNSRKRLCQSQFDVSAAAKNACDIIVTQTIDRFGNSDFLKAFRLLDPVEFVNYRNIFPNKLLQTLVNEYPFIDGVKLKTELEVLYTDQLLEPPAVRSITALFKAIRNFDLDEIFYETVKVLKVILTTPSSTAEEERKFSTLERIKTATRNRIEGQDRLNALACLSIHQSMDISNEQIIDMFGSIKERRAELLFE